MVKLAIAGALGRMGQAVAKAAAERDGVDVVARFDRLAGEGLVSREEALSLADVVIDFTSGEASADLARVAAMPGGPALVIGSTGWTPEAEAAVLEAARSIPIVKSGNYSLGVNVLTGLVAKAAWPKVDPALLVDNEVTIAVQHMGKLRDTLTVAKGLPKDQLEALALASEKVQRALDGKAVKKVIVVPDRLVNLVA